MLLLFACRRVFVLGGGETVLLLCGKRLLVVQTACLAFFRQWGVSRCKITVMLKKCGNILREYGVGRKMWRIFRGFRYMEFAIKNCRIMEEGAVLTMMRQNVMLPYKLMP